MRDYLDLGCAPSHEDCAQLGTAGYWERARKECRAYIDQLRRQFGPEPNGAHFSVKLNAHDFGTYLSTICWFDDQHEASVNYAFQCESQGPKFWDEEARRELGLETATRKEN